MRRIRMAWRPLTVAMALTVAATATVSTAQARDGVSDFFQQIFGGGDQGTSRPLPQPDYGYAADAVSPPLTVRMRPHRHHTRAASAPARSPKDSLAALKGVTIMTDKTLEPGDFVMTASGMRMFNGSNSWPYRDDDFVALSDARHVAPTLRKQLHAIDVASRVAFAR